MKKTTMMLLIVGALAVPAVAADPTINPTVETKAPAKTVWPILRLAHLRAAPSDKIERLGNISSRPWDRAAGRPAPPLFEDQREYVGQPNFALLWVGNAP